MANTLGLSGAYQGCKTRLTNEEPWSPGPCGPVGWSVILCNKRLRVQFLVRTHAWLWAWSQLGCIERQPMDVCLPFSFLPFSSL